MKKTIILLSCCLLTLSLVAAGTAQAGAGCCPKGAKVEKAEKASCSPKACASTDQAMTKTCVVDGKTVTCTVNADGSCTMPAGTVQNAAGATTKTCVVDGKTVTCTVNADGSCTMAGANAACQGPKSACGDKPACGDKKAASKAADKKAGI
ncbi:MAG: hypothetical protein WC326_10840 [Candidatus Delongbacteria bacterium]